MAVNTENLAYTLTDDALKAFEMVKDKFPNVGDFNKNPEVLLNMQGENAQVIGALYKDTIGISSYVCRNGRAISECAREISRVDKRVGLALLAGGAALCLGGYIYMRMSQQQKEIDNLRLRILNLEARK